MASFTLYEKVVIVATITANVLITRKIVRDLSVYAQRKRARGGRIPPAALAAERGDQI